jgi:hypothetical protein
VKLTKARLKQLIKEELQKILTEQACADGTWNEMSCVNAGGTWDVRPGTDQMCCMKPRGLIKDDLVEKLGRELGQKVDAMLARSEPTNGFSQKKKGKVGPPPGFAATEPPEREWTEEDRRRWRTQVGHIAGKFQDMAKYAIKGHKKALQRLQGAAKLRPEAQALLDAVYEERPELDPRRKQAGMSPEELEFELN